MTHSHTLRVYYEDTDAGGIVYYANYLRFMERARTEWLAAIGFPLAAFEREHGVVFVVHRCEIDYLRPARLNDALDVTVEVADRGAARLVLVQNVARAEQLLTAARVTLAALASHATEQRMQRSRKASAITQEEHTMDWSGFWKGFWGGMPSAARTGWTAP